MGGNGTSPSHHWYIYGIFLFWVPALLVLALIADRTGGCAE
jgi:hypothetical protein